MSRKQAAIERLKSERSGIPVGMASSGPAAVTAMLADEREHNRPLAARDSFSRMALSLVEQAGEDIRAKLAAPDMVHDFVTAIGAGLKVRDRTCMNLYPRLLKMVDDEKRLIVEIWSNLGVSGPEEARQKIAMAQSVEGASPHDGAQTCVGYLESYLAMYPAQRTAIVQRLGGMVAASSADYAQEGT